MLLLFVTALTNLLMVLEDEIKQLVRKIIGPIAQPEHVQIVSGLPKTRSGKIMRRILRKVASRDLSNLGIYLPF